MAMDTRDYYRDRLRKQAGYVERAPFRVSLGDVAREKHRAAWRRNWLIVAAVIAAIALARVLR
jgi:hypothetical protein